jgi:glutathione S-transferase
MYRFYYSPGACSLAVHIILEETGASYEMDLRSTRGPDGVAAPEYKEINPKSRVPALSDVKGRAIGASGVLTEAPAVLVFLARRFPEAGLMPSDCAAEARCLEWLTWLSSELHAAGFAVLWRPSRFIHDPDRFAEVEARGRETIRERFNEVEAILSDGREWSVEGCGYTIVEPYLLVFWRWGTRIDFDMSAWPIWSRLMLRVLDRPAVQRALAGGHV